MNAEGRTAKGLLSVHEVRRSPKRTLETDRLYHNTAHAVVSASAMARARLAATRMVVALLVALAGSAGCADAAWGVGSEPPPFRVMLATPCYDGQVTHAFHLSVVRAYEHYHRDASSRGQEVFLSSAMVPGIADLPKARAALVSRFLKETPRLTHLLFVDADIAFEPELIARLARSGKDVVAGMYPKRHVNWENIARYVESRKSASKGDDAMDAVRAAGAHEYPFEFEHESGDRPRGGETGPLFVDANGFARVKRVPTGFTMISRDALERTIEHFPELTFVDPDSGHLHHALFHPLFVDFEKSDATRERLASRTYLSEDFSFCDRWRSVPGNDGVWVDTVGWVDHVVSPTVKFSGKAWMSRFLAKSDEL